MSFRDAGKQVLKIIIIIIIYYLFFLENNASDFSFIFDRVMETGLTSTLGNS